MLSRTSEPAVGAGRGRGGGGITEERGALGDGRIPRGRYDDTKEGWLPIKIKWQSDLEGRDGPELQERAVCTLGWPPGEMMARGRRVPVR